jgi:putative aldouronate transport system permease protein
VADTLLIEPRKHTLLQALYRHRWLYLMILPGIAAYVIFTYLPMYGIVLAFKTYKVRLGITGSPWVGLANFVDAFRDDMFWRAFRNTLVISVGKTLIGFPAPIILAILLNELRNERFKRVSQSLLYLPHFLSWVIIAGLIFSLFSASSGAVSKLIVGVFGGKPLAILGNPRYFLWLVYLSDIWQGAGWGTIIFLAALSGINPELYESAYMDGAGRLRMIWSITLPSMSYAITVMLILSVGYLMEAGFQQVFNLYSPSVYSVGDIIDTYVYRLGIKSARYELSTAVGLFQSVINCGLLLATNKIVKLLGGEGIF